MFPKRGIFCCRFIYATTHAQAGRNKLLRKTSLRESAAAPIAAAARSQPTNVAPSDGGSQAAKGAGLGLSSLSLAQDRAGEVQGPTLGRAHGCKPEQARRHSLPPPMDSLEYAAHF